MTNPQTKTMTSRVLDTIFGERLTGVELEQAMAASPPRPVRWALMSLFLGWLGLTAFCAAVVRGWTPLPREAFDSRWFFLLALAGLAYRLVSEAVYSHYRRRFRRSAEAVQG